MTNITVVMPTSPIKSNPDTDIIEETLLSVRRHLPDATTMLLFDGVRGEQEDIRANYEEFTRRALWLADNSWENVSPFVFTGHFHQSGMMRQILREIDTPLLMYVEHDTPLVDRDINWGAVTSFIETGEANLVRFHHEPAIPQEHKHMMGSKTADFLRTTQWSQRPHVATTEYYQKIMAEHFSLDTRSFIEDRMHSVAANAPWYENRLYVYHPPGNIRFSYHLDGRAGGQKYDESQVF